MVAVQELYVYNGYRKMPIGERRVVGLAVGLHSERVLFLCFLLSHSIVVSFPSRSDAENTKKKNVASSSFGWASFNFYVHFFSAQCAPILQLAVVGVWHVRKSVNDPHGVYFLHLRLLQLVSLLFLFSPLSLFRTGVSSTERWASPLSIPRPMAFSICPLAHGTML